MTLENYAVMAMGALAIVVQFLILRFSWEKQRCEGRILLLLGKVADRDLEKHESLGSTVIDLLEQESKLRLAKTYSVKEATDPEQRTMLKTIHHLERRRALLDKKIIALFLVMSLFLAVLLYLIFQHV